MATSTHTAPAKPLPPGAKLPPTPVLGLVGLAVVLAILMVVMRPSNRTTKRGALDAKVVSLARKRYVAAIDRRLAKKIDHYSLLLESRNLVNGFYEQKGLVVGVRFAVKQANCAKCKALDGKEVSLLDAEQVAALTPPTHGEVRRGVRCVTMLIPIQAERAKGRGTGKI